MRPSCAMAPRREHHRQHIVRRELHFTLEDFQRSCLRACLDRHCERESLHCQFQGLSWVGSLLRAHSTSATRRERSTAVATSEATRSSKAKDVVDLAVPAIGPEIAAGRLITQHDDGAQPSASGMDPAMQLKQALPGTTDRQPPVAHQSRRDFGDRRPLDGPPP